MENIQFPLSEAQKDQLIRELKDSRTSIERVDEIRLIANADEQATQKDVVSTDEKQSFDTLSDQQLHDRMLDPAVSGKEKDAIVEFLQNRANEESLPPESQ